MFEVDGKPSKLCPCWRTLDLGDRDVWRLRGWEAEYQQHGLHLQRCLLEMRRTEILMGVPGATAEHRHLLLQFDCVFVSDNVFI